MSREVITLHIGQAGCQGGLRLWELFCEEHGILADGTRHQEGEIDQDDMHFASFFNDTHSGQYVPRSIFVDTDPMMMEKLSGSKFGKLFHPDYMLGYKRDCKNNFFEGKSMASEFHIKEDVLDRVRMAVGLCNNLQGFFVFHSWGGGTGSGLGAEVIHEVYDQYPRCSIFETVIYPSTDYSSCIVEPYNCMLSMNATKDEVSLSLMLDNQAAYAMCQDRLAIPEPDFKDLNRLIAQVISSCTTSLRYETVINSTLMEILHNIVPSRQFRYPVLALSPVCAVKRGKHEQFSTPEIITELFEPRSMMANLSGHMQFNRYLAAVVLLRGLDTSEDSKPESFDAMPIQAGEAIPALHGLRKEGMGKRALKFVPWMEAHGFKVGVVGVPPCVPEDFKEVMAESKRQGALLANTTAVRTLFARQYIKFLNLFFHKAYAWQYITAGGTLDDFEDAKQGVRGIIDEYERLLSDCVDAENDPDHDGRRAQVRLKGRTHVTSRNARP